MFIYFVVQLALFRNIKLIFHHRKHIKQNVLCSTVQKYKGIFNDSA